MLLSPSARRRTSAHFLRPSLEFPIMDSDLAITRRDMVKGGAAAMALAAAGAPVPAQAQGAAMVSGFVFEDRSGTGRRQPGDPGLAGVLVSNGREVAKTDASGRYVLPIEEASVVFVIKPTGPLPASVDFPLRKTEEPQKFDVLLFTDPQPESPGEVDFVRDDVVNALIGTKAAFGLTAGDIMFDDLSLYPRQNRIIGQIGMPWWNIGGNHDLNFEAPGARYSRETFKRVFGPTSYAFEYGGALFVMLDNVEYLGTDPNRPRKNGKYQGRIGERQRAFIANVLAETPADRLVVAVMHIPLRTYLDPQAPGMNTLDRSEFLKQIGR